MNSRYMVVIALFIVGCGSVGKFLLKAAESKATVKKEMPHYIACIKSSGEAVDCGVFAVQKNKPTLLHSLNIANHDIGANFTDVVCTMLTQIKSDYDIDVHHACFVAPGVPSEQQDYLTHWRLPYIIDTKAIIKKSGLTTAIIVNDFLAMSYGVDYMNTKDITSLHNVPAELHGRRAIIGAGDGLGSVVMVWNECNNSYKSLPAEAGTGNFPAFTQFEFDLVESMKKIRNFETCHWAFFAAVPGIAYTYKILKNMDQYADAPDLGDLDGMGILAHAHDDELCKTTADMFYKYYARFAYNFCFTTLPFGGLYLVGATATEHPAMLSDIFLPEFFNCVASKQHVMKRIPVYVIHADTNLGLYGGVQYMLIEKNLFA